MSPLKMPQSARLAELDKGVEVHIFAPINGAEQADDGGSVLHGTQLEVCC